jgi:hypothetical protein
VQFQVQKRRWRSRTGDDFSIAEYPPPQIRPVLPCTVDAVVKSMPEARITLPHFSVPSPMIFWIGRASPQALQRLSRQRAPPKYLPRTVALSNGFIISGYDWLRADWRKRIA